MEYTPEFMNQLASFEDLEKLSKVEIGKVVTCPSCGHIAPIGADPDKENKKPMKIKVTSNYVEAQIGSQKVWHEFGRVLAVCPLCKTTAGVFVPIKQTHMFGLVPPKS